ncbi:MAG: OsmC family peroxiredoxin [Chloroflexia bacterium]
MARADRSAQVEWKGNLQQGSGKITSTGSGAFGVLPVTWAARTESSDGKTSPEELLAMSQASCYAMQFSSVLAKAGHAPEELNVSAVATFDPPKITTMKIEVKGKVPDLDQAEFERLAAQAEQLCPVANAIRNNVDIQLTAHLLD